MKTKIKIRRNLSRKMREEEKYKGRNENTRDGASEVQKHVGETEYQNNRENKFKKMKRIMSL